MTFKLLSYQVLSQVILTELLQCLYVKQVVVLILVLVNAIKNDNDHNLNATSACCINWIIYIYMDSDAYLSASY